MIRGGKARGEVADQPEADEISAKPGNQSNINGANEDRSTPFHVIRIDKQHHQKIRSINMVDVLSSSIITATLVIVMQ